MPTARTYAATAERAAAARIARATLSRYDDPSESVLVSAEQIFEALLAQVRDQIVEGSAVTDAQVLGTTIAAVRIAAGYR